MKQKKLTREQITTDTIILPYRELFKRQFMPKDKQYWTTDPKELDILLEEGFIKKSQFKTYSRKGWAEEMMEQFERKSKPEVIYYECNTVHGISHLTSIMMRLRSRTKNVMVVCSFVFGKKYRGSGYNWQRITIDDPNVFIQQLHNHIPSFSKRWNWIDHCYEYQKTNSQLKMGRLIFSPHFLPAGKRTGGR
jgi:hypothetical protein